MRSVSIVVPCYNEADGVPQLKAKLVPILNRLKSRYVLQLILVDDGSLDETYSLLEANFSSVENCKVVRHEKNMNLGAAIRTGFSHSNGDWIAYLDSDCTYDPAFLEPMLEQMESGADLVTVSPYHPKGKVVGVPEYRLFLSKSLTAIYRVILRQKIYTFTAMVRIYRKDILKDIASAENDFSAVAEMMLKALKQHAKVVELPATLTVRRFGESKMKTARVIKAHLRLIGKLLFKPRCYLA